MGVFSRYFRWNSWRLFSSSSLLANASREYSMNSVKCFCSNLIVNKISLRIFVYINDGSNWSKFFLETLPLVGMKLMEIAFCSHPCATCLRATQIDAISVKIPLILGHSLTHCPWYFLLLQKIKIESTW